MISALGDSTSLAFYSLYGIYPELGFFFPVADMGFQIAGDNGRVVF